MNASRTAYWWMLAAALSFSVMSTGTNALKTAYDWQTIAVVRTMIALVLTISLARAAGSKLVLFEPKTLWMRSLAGSCALLANFYCLTHFPAPETLALTNLFPLWVAILSWPILGQRPRIDVWPAIFTALAGVFLMLQPQFHHGWLPIALAFLSSWASAIALIGLHKLKNVDPPAVVVHFSGVSLVCALFAWGLTPHALVTSGPVFAHPAALLALVGISATFGQLFLTKAFAAGPPAQIAVVNLTQVGLTLVFERMFIGRELDPLTLLGMALVLAPTAWVMTRGK